MIRYAVILFGIGISLSLSAQDWLPMDRGLHCPALAAGTGTVREFIRDENQNELYAIGLIRYNGYCQEQHVLMQWDGSTWTEVGNPIGYNGRSGVIYENKILAFGEFTSEPDFRLHILENENWEPQPEGPESSVFDFEVYEDTLFMGGTFRTLGSDTTFLVGKYHDGQFSGITRDYPDAGTFCYAIANYQGDLYMGGNFTLNPDDGVAQTFSNLAKVQGDSLVPVGEDFLNSGSTSVIIDLEVFQDKLYISGGFEEVNGYTGNSIMAWNGDAFESLGEGVNSNIVSMEVYDEELYVLGYFTELEGEPCNYLAKWNGTEWTCLNQTLLDNENERLNFRALTIYNNQLIVGGRFTTVNGDSLNSVAIIDGAVGLGEADTGNSDYTVYPNPSNGSLNISGPFMPNEQYTLELYDLLGSIIFTEEHLLVDGSINRELPSYISNGIYQLRCSSDGIPTFGLKVLLE